MARGRKVHADEAADLLEQWEASREPLTKWCAARGLNWYSLSAFKGWRGTARNAEPHVSFAEVVVEADFEAVPIGGVGRYRVELGNVVVEVDDHFQEATLRRLLRVVAC